MTDELRGVFTALVTPFVEEGEIDWEALARLVDRQIDAGVHGLVPCGTTGESPALSRDEHDRVVRFVVERTAGRVPVMAGTGTATTAETVSRTEAARETGANAVLVVTPYYNRPTPRGLITHYRSVATVGLPVVVYHIPSRTGTTITEATYRALAEIPGVVATKEASGDLALAQRLLAAGSLRVFSGDDAWTFPLLCLGGCGVVSVTSNIVPRALVDLYDFVQSGDLERARQQQWRWLPLMRALFRETSPAPIKAALASRGLCGETLRPPLVPVTSETREAVIAALQVEVEA